MKMVNKVKKIEKEIEDIAKVENEFKALGKLIYSAWLSKEYHNFEGIMENFDSIVKPLLSKLKETKNDS